MVEGIVKWFNNDKGYGFIEHNNQDYFVYYSDIKIKGFKTLNPNQNVTFEPQKTPKGLVAKKVCV